MGYIEMVFSRIRRKKPKPPSISRRDFLRLKPVRNPALKWKKDDEGRIRIIIPLMKPSEKKKKSSSRIINILAKALPEPPKEKYIQLDEIGSVVWELCDGENKAKDIADHLCRKYKLLPIEAEMPLSKYLNDLAKRGLISFILPEDLQKRLGKEKLPGGMPISSS
ncbi:PqqD family protein [Candidatus Bathyarchaeota archaeon]|nr:MAG: PqqD family protein [Candidatus Bathyarchaeota archaeon]